SAALERRQSHEAIRDHGQEPESNSSNPLCRMLSYPVGRVPMTVAHPADSFQPPLTPRNGHTLMVLGIARISTEHQDALSLDDQEALYRQWLAQHTGLPFTLTRISGRGSGECLDRQEALRATAAVETGTYDLVIAEDLGRIFRRIHAQLFCELCED